MQAIHGIDKLPALQSPKIIRMTTPFTSNKSSNQNPILRADDLACVRGDMVLFENLSFELSQGRCLHVIGANGSGKTSLLRIICGLNSAENGHVIYDGTLLGRSETARAEMAYIGHKDGLKNELTAIENLRFQQRLEGLSDENHLDDCLAQLKILRCADLPAQSLSFGQRRRLAFARLLLSPKRVWVLDEPFTGIDTQGRSLIESICVQHLESDGAIIMTHHQSLDASSISPFKDELILNESGHHE